MDIHTMRKATEKERPTYSIEEIDHMLGHSLHSKYVTAKKLFEISKSYRESNDNYINDQELYYLSTARKLIKTDDFNVSPLQRQIELRIKEKGYSLEQSERYILPQHEIDSIDVKF